MGTKRLQAQMLALKNFPNRNNRKRSFCFIEKPNEFLQNVFFFLFFTTFLKFSSYIFHMRKPGKPSLKSQLKFVGSSKQICALIFHVESLPHWSRRCENGKLFGASEGKLFSQLAPTNLFFTSPHPAPPSLTLLVQFTLNSFACVSYLHSYFLYTLLRGVLYVWGSGALTLTLTHTLTHTQAHAHAATD